MRNFELPPIENIGAHGDFLGVMELIVHERDNERRILRKDGTVVARNHALHGIRWKDKQSKVLDPKWAEECLSVLLGTTVYVEWRGNAD